MRKIANRTGRDSLEIPWRKSVSFLVEPLPGCPSFSSFYILLLPRHHIKITKATFGRSWKTIQEEDAGFKWRHKLDYSPQTRPYRTVLWKWAEYRLRRLPFLLTQKTMNNAIYLLNAKAFKYMVSFFIDLLWKVNHAFGVMHESCTLTKTKQLKHTNSISIILKSG